MKPLDSQKGNGLAEAAEGGGKEAGGGGGVGSVIAGAVERAVEGLKKVALS